MSKTLYPIIENGLWGFIDDTGKEIIQPQFYSVGQFSEGLAPARKDGTYGFINKQGKFVIHPQFDVAYSFEKGQAKVFIDEKPYFIDKKGNLTFEHNFQMIHGFNDNDISIVKSKSERFGVINRKGEMIVDTLHKRINPFSRNRAIVLGQNHTPFPDDDETDPTFEVGVIDVSGHFIVPFGKYSKISDFNSDFTKAEFILLGIEVKCMINLDGKLTLNLSRQTWNLDYGNENFSEGLATISIPSVDHDTVKVWSSSKRYDYKGVINPNGEIIFSNKDWDEITPFKNNRAFVQDANDNWFLINKQGQIISKPFEEILFDNYNPDPESFFQGGIEFVLTEEGLGAIDTTGTFVIQPRIFSFDYDRTYRRGSTIFFDEDISLENESYSYQYGFWDTTHDLIVEPRFHEINLEELSGKIFHVKEKNRLGYINRKGIYVWQVKEINSDLLFDLNIDHMNRGYFYASSPIKKELSGVGGWGKAVNNFKKIKKSKDFKTDKLSVVVNTKENGKFAEGINGIKLFVVNTTSDTIYFDAQDSRLYLKIQAKDKEGNWRDIEYLPSSWCGNSYHSLFLPEDHIWEFTIPKYDGGFQTKLRAELLYKKDFKDKDSITLYSNEFDGKVNPAQFWRKIIYYPLGLMDPYND